MSALSVSDGRYDEHCASIGAGVWTGTRHYVRFGGHDRGVGLRAHGAGGRTSRPGQRGRVHCPWCAQRQHRTELRRAGHHLSGNWGRAYLCPESLWDRPVGLPGWLARLVVQCLLRRPLGHRLCVLAGSDCALDPHCAHGDRGYCDLHAAQCVGRQLRGPRTTRLGGSSSSKTTGGPDWRRCSARSP